MLTQAQSHEYSLKTLKILGMAISTAINRAKDLTIMIMRRDGLKKYAAHVQQEAAKYPERKEWECFDWKDSVATE